MARSTVARSTEETAQRRSARQEYPEDRFDRVPRSGRVGAHRLTPRPRHVWHYVIAGLLGFAILTGIGIIAVQVVGDRGKLPGGGPTSSSSQQEQGPTAKLDPEATVAILNGSESENLASALGEIVAEEQWGNVLFSGSAATTDVEISAVFYADEADAAAAAGLAAELGGLSTYTSAEYEEFGAQLIVLLGADYQGPGIEEAQQKTAEEATPETTAPPAEPPAVNPETGNAIDPVTGWDIDPVTGFPINPETGVPTDPATLDPGAVAQ